MAKTTTPAAASPTDILMAAPAGELPRIDTDQNFFDALFLEMYLHPIQGEDASSRLPRYRSQ